MFDINFSFDGLFKGCLPFTNRKKKNKEISLEDLENILRKETDKNTIISEILLKITNGKYSCSMLYEYEYDNTGSIITHKLKKQIGDYDINKIISANLISIPIWTKNILTHSLIILDEPKNYEDELNRKTIRLIQLLQNYL